MDSRRRVRSNSPNRTRASSPRRSTAPVPTTVPINNNHSSSDEENTNTDKDEFCVPPVLRLAVSGLSGMLFGIALEKGRVFEPQIIRDQMLMRRFAMMKMFLAASATSAVSFSILTLLPKTSQALKKATKEYQSSMEVKTVLGVAIGGALLGCGMTLAGSCPGLVLVQCGAGITTAAFTLLGCMSGGLLYALTFPLVDHLHQKPGNRKYFLHHYFKVNYLTIAVPFVAMLTGAIAGFEYFFPWDSEVSVSEESTGIMTTLAWPPFIAGALVGLLQIPIVLANQDTLGSATSYITVGSQLLITKSLRKLFGYMKSFSWGVRNWWQVTFVGGAVLGAFLSSQASSTWGSVTGVSAWMGFGGGLMMVYGSRMAGGCTSGHGLSGMGLLALMSFVAVPAMFKAGIGTAFLLKLLGVDEFQ